MAWPYAVSFALTSCFARVDERELYLILNLSGLIIPQLSNKISAHIKTRSSDSPQF